MGRGDGSLSAPAMCCTPRVRLRRIQITSTRIKHRATTPPSAAPIATGAFDEDDASVSLESIPELIGVGAVEDDCCFVLDRIDTLLENVVGLVDVDDAKNKSREYVV